MSLKIEEPVRAPPTARFALWELGFRPFYLLASGFAALSIALWALQFSGWLGHPYLAGPMWHAHEMLFGFMLAVIVGFLFTAGRNWSNQPTPTGVSLAALAALWLAARILVLTPFGWAAAIANVAFPLAAAIALARPFITAGNRRNYFFIALLLLLSAAAAAVHLSQLGVVRMPGFAGIQIGLDVVLFIVAVMAGRVVPMFTNNGVPGAAAGRRPWLERLALGALLVLLLGDALQLHGPVLVALLVVGALAHLGRWLLWQPWKTLRTPIVWVLHVAYFWIPLHLLLRALAELGLVPTSASTHALTVGAISGMIIGMITRTALGHTGRPLVAGRVEVACYLLVLLSALVRVFVPLAVPQHTLLAVSCSAALWSAAFGLYALRYWPILTRPRVDGKPG
ncbi:MAG: NnrS family protein [Caldimonas sp.]